MSEKKKNKVIILGGNGFLGSNLSRSFSEAGYEVSCFDMEPPSCELEGVSYISGNFFDSEELFAATEDKDLIIHALSTINPGNSNDGYMRGYEGDFLQTVRLFDRLATGGQRAIFISSGGTVYGEQSVQPIPESAATHPTNHYGSLKLCIENVLRAFNAQRGAKFIIARPSNPYGPGQDYRKGVGFIDAAVKKAPIGETIEIWGAGEIVRDYIHIDDLCRMFLALAQYIGDLDTFNLSSGRGASQNEVIAILKEIGLSPKVEYKDARSVDVRSIVLSNERISGLTGGGIMTLREGLRDFLNHLKCHPQKRC